MLADARRLPSPPGRPWIATVRAERAAEYFDLDAPSPFAHRLARVVPGRAAELPGVVRTDGWARVHTVDRLRASRLHDLLGRLPVLAAAPLLAPDGLAPESPDDAIAAWRGAALDALYLQGRAVDAGVAP
jgi:carbamoyltransferase